MDVADNNFQAKVLEADGPILVDIWAPGCGPCRMVGAALERIAAKRSGDFTLAYANLEEFSQTAETLNVRATPTLLLYRNGQEVARRSGALLESQLSNWLDQHLS